MKLELTLKVQLAEVTSCKLNLITVNFYTAVFHYTGHRGNSLRPFEAR